MLPLILSIEREGRVGTQPIPAGHGCVYCGLEIGLHADGPRCCALCHLARHLERPRINDELQLIWLPELSQAALICIVREIHCRQRGLGEDLDAPSLPAVVTAESRAIHYTRTVFVARADVAAEHLGTKLPSELAQILSRLSRDSYERRYRLLAGLRGLPSGRFFIGSENVYPAIADSWRQIGKEVDQISIQSAA